MVNAQNDYKPGFVVTNNGDTLRGKVKDRIAYPSAEKFDKIRFKSHGFISRKYSADQISAYRSGSIDYESHWLDLQRNRFREKYISRKGEGRQVFLLVNVRSGVLNYYSLEYINQESGMIESVPLFKRPNDDYFVRVTQGVLGLKRKLLVEYFSDCPELREMIKAGKISTPNEIVRQYNGCPGNVK